jgi:ubiquinone/menaquinone biosynthesis C-methylase UbiE
MELDETQRAAQEQFGRQSGRYGSGHILADTGDVEGALEAVALPPQADVLDVATGAGHTGVHLARLGHCVIVSDVALPMLEQAQAAADEAGASIEIRQHAAELLPYADESFDLVTCRVAAHHFSRPSDFVKESARVLRPGGWFLVIDGTVEDGFLEAEEWAHAVEKLRDPSHGRFVTPRRWEALCEAAGLEVERCRLEAFKQPDLEWYFETAATPAENRVKVMDLIENVPAQAKALFRVGVEEGKIVWWWRRMTLVARKR